MFADELIKEGLELIRSNQDHDLRVGFRCKLLSSLDDLGNGQRRRTELAVLTIEKVLPIWESVLPTDYTPKEALNLAKQFLDDRIAPEAVEIEIGRLWVHCDDLSCRFSEKQSEIMVGYGAVQAIREALSPRHFGCEGVTKDSTDMDVDPYDHDSAFCAMIAYSNGPVWADCSDSKKRLEFWTWWLMSGVRTIFNTE